MNPLQPQPGPGTRSIIFNGLLLAMVLFACAGSALSQNKSERVHFERGKSAATIHGRVAGFDTHDYVLGAQAGQQMDIKLTAANPETYFVLYSINGKATDMNETDHYSLETTESGDYVIRVFMMRAAARRKGAASNYTLTISIR
ncbi:MAG TPA: hypothetical protein VE961_13265 [Pyrinomonadaceae bacterium]|nr:hypothetical protein [Pyrinomonadaceae bacterium]